MSLFVAYCLDRPGALQTRLDNRAAHLDFLAAEAAHVKTGGPLLDEQFAPAEIAQQVEQLGLG